MADGIVHLTADFTAAPGTQTTATVERGTSATGPWVLLDTVDLLAQVGAYYDTSAPLDTPVWYRWTGDPGGTTIVQGPFTEASTGTVWVKDPLRPWANLEFSFCATAQAALNDLCTPTGPDLIWVGWGDETRRADVTLSDRYGAERPADVFGLRKNRDSEIRFMSRTPDAYAAVHALFTGGGPLQIQAPPAYLWEDAFVQPLDLVAQRIHPDQRKPYRLWAVPVTVVDRPSGPAQGTVCANWCAVSDTYATYADLTATGFTWAQIEAGAAGGAGC